MAAKRKTRGRSTKSDRVSNTIKNEILGIIIVGIACLGLVLLFSEGTSPVANAAVSLLKVIAGDGSAGIFVVLAAVGIALMGRNKKILKSRIIGIILLWIVLEGFIHLGATDNYSSAELLAIGKAGHGGGLIGFGVTAFLINTVGLTAGYVLLVVTAIIASVLVINRSLVATVRDLFLLIAKAIKAIMRQINDFVKVLGESDKEENDRGRNKASVFSSAKKKDTKVIPEYIFEPEFLDNLIGDNYREESELKSREILRHEPEIIPDKKVDALAEDKNALNVSSIKLTGTPLSRQTERNENYKLPPLSLVHKAMKRGQKSNKDLADNVRLLEDTLASFGVKVKVTRVTQGPTITRYEVQPAPGVKVSKITSLADDIALSLAASDVRIEAPIPGKAVVGIEVPNKEIALVHFRDVLECEEFQSSQSKLTLALGKDIAGTPVMADLTRMPHLLIAGATGSGKSVCINTIIASIVYKAKPDEVKLLLIDPKVVELTNYNGIPHLIAPVVTEPSKAAGALKWIVSEMETRYELFASSGVRDIVRFNYIVSEKKDNIELKPLPYVVVIIDELADLMMVAPGEVEEAICRLAQMARASGIHLIVATQRPSVDVITGLIKANIPSRIAFSVSSQIDSRTILDMGGAEKLLGRGDMLYHPIGISKPVRVQGSFLADKEVKNIVDYLKAQARPEYHEIPVTSLNVANTVEPNDELFIKAANIFIENNTASVSLLQRRLRIGYTRAARIMDFLEEKGVVGQYEGSKPREVLMTKGQFEQKFGKVEDL